MACSSCEPSRPWLQHKQTPSPCTPEALLDRDEIGNDRGWVVFQIPGGNNAVVVEIADEPAERSRGLMNRTELQHGHGMVFVFPQVANHSFWMKDTPIALDMIFLSDSCEVVGVVQNAVPFSTTSRSVGIPSRYVVEVPGGYAQEKQITQGIKATLHHVPQVVFE